MSTATQERRPQQSLADLLRMTPYAGYAYAYPHKTAYRSLAPARNLAEVWASEPQNALFLYFHVPFCEMRCGFCNLFTESHSRNGLASRVEALYLDALERHASIVRSVLPKARFAHGAIGGGTPTFLSAAGLERLLQTFATFSRAEAFSCSVEASPFTATRERLQILRAHHVHRLSLGVQSFVPAEVAGAGRAQSRDEVETALDHIRALRFPVVNLDLIYGLPGQTLASWKTSLEQALRWKPEELYLYPLYVRPITGLARKEPEKLQADEEWDAFRLDCYRLGREILRSNGYRQLSMRHFRRTAVVDVSGDYCCQQDGTVAIGCGGRSYTRALHYSREYAVSGAGVHEIIKRYVASSDHDLGLVDYGFELDVQEQRRRYIIKSLLRADGLNTQAYQRYFGTGVLDDMPSLYELVELKLAELRSEHLRPTERGLELSDIIGPWLASGAVQQRMQAFALR